MKKVFEIILGLASLFFLMVAGAENPDGSCSPVWTIGFLTLALICGWGWKKLNTYKPSRNV